MSKEKPIVATFVLVTGDRVETVFSREIGREQIRQSMRWRSPPFNPSVLDDLDTTTELAHLLRYMYGQMLRNDPERGMFIHEDQEGRCWAIPAFRVVAVSVTDPDQVGRAPGRPVGFTHIAVPDDREA